jgi:opacity protein-like surface antigen
MKKILIALIAFMINVMCFSQEISTYSIDFYSSNKIAGLHPLYLQGNIRLIENLETGIYIGFSYTESVLYNYQTEVNEEYDATSIFTGLMARYYILSNKKRVSPYLSAKAGVVSTRIDLEVSSDDNRTSFDYGIYGGVKIKVQKPVSVFAEVGYSNYDMVRLGISVDL